MNNNRLQILYQKTEFNHHKICHLKGIFSCCKCKKNNTIMPNSNVVQFCLFCGTPNSVANKIDSMKNIK